MSDLVTRSCKPCEGGVPPLDTTAVQQHLTEVPQWETSSDGKWLEREFGFKNYYETIAFVNGIAWMTHQENHHPDLEVGFKKCRVRYTTPAVGGLTENDFICAAKIDSLL